MDHHPYVSDQQTARTLQALEADVADLRAQVADAPARITVPGATRGWFRAQIVETAPAGHSIPADEPIYAVKEVKGNNAVADGDSETFAFRTNPRHVMATNTAEPEDSHSLNEEDTADATGRVIVQVFEDVDENAWSNTTPSGPRFFFSRGVASRWIEMEPKRVADDASSADILLEYTGAGAEAAHANGLYAFSLDGSNNAEVFPETTVEFLVVLDEFHAYIEGGAAGQGEYDIYTDLMVDWIAGAWNMGVTYATQPACNVVAAYTAHGIASIQGHLHDADLWETGLVDNGGSADRTRFLIQNGDTTEGLTVPADCYGIRLRLAEGGFVSHDNQDNVLVKVTHPDVFPSLPRVYYRKCPVGPTHVF